MNIAILGFGLQGKSVYEFYNSKQNSITICDTTEPINLPADVKVQIGPNYLHNLERFDLIFRSPSIHPNQILEFNDQSIMSKITTNTNEFMRLCPTKNIIGVTGTKGKGTTSVLITKILESLDIRVHLGGNIGIPPLDLLRENIRSEDYVVLELANFQLIDFKYPVQIGVCLLVEPEHLDWHSDINEYYQSKTELFRHQNKEGIAIYYAKNETSKRIASTGPAHLIPYFEDPGALIAGNHIVIDGTPIIRLNEIKLLGEHNWQNICAAITACWQIQRDPVAIANALKNFWGLPYRLEFRREVNNLKFYNDSFSSAPTSLIAAIEAIKGNKVIIVGGKDRGLDLTNLIRAIKNHQTDIDQLILIGESSQRLMSELKKNKFYKFAVCESRQMSIILDFAIKHASLNDSVVLSPGFPSFDMFKNFEDRGQQFNTAVANL